MGAFLNILSQLGKGVGKGFGKLGGTPPFVPDGGLQDIASGNQDPEAPLDIDIGRLLRQGDPIRGLQSAVTGPIGSLLASLGLNPNPQEVPIGSAPPGAPVPTSTQQGSTLGRALQGIAGVAIPAILAKNNPEMAAGLARQSTVNREQNQRLLESILREQQSRRAARTQKGIEEGRQKGIQERFDTQQQSRLDSQALEVAIQAGSSLDPELAKRMGLDPQAPLQIKAELERREGSKILNSFKTSDGETEYIAALMGDSSVKMIPIGKTGKPEIDKTKDLLKLPPGTTLFDTDTGQPIYRAPDRPRGEAKEDEMDPTKEAKDILKTLAISPAKPTEEGETPPVGSVSEDLFRFLVTQLASELSGGADREELTRRLQESLSTLTGKRVAQQQGSSLEDLESELIR